MKTSSIISLVLLLCSIAQAASDQTTTVKATVNGMVCSFCAQGILAHFKKHPAVSDVRADLTRKAVLLEERKGKEITDKEITEHIRKSGFEQVKVERLKQRFAEAKAV